MKRLHHFMVVFAALSVLVGACSPPPASAAAPAAATTASSVSAADSVPASSAAAAMSAAPAASAMAAASTNPVQGNYLISDQYNNRVIEVDKNLKIVWQFGDGSSVAGPKSIVAPNDAQRVGNLTLMAGTGAPAGAEPTCPNGCADNRVMLVDQTGAIVWQYGTAGATGSGANQLNTPVQATWLPNTDVLITDQGNQRVIEVNTKKKIVWQYGTTGTSGADANQLNNPNSAELLDNGNILIADESNNRVIEVTRDHKIVWTYGDPGNPSLLNGSAFASRLSNGDTLITDSGNNCMVEVDSTGKVVWRYVTNDRPGSVDGPIPTRGVRLSNGDTLISDQFNHQVIEVNMAGKIVFSMGTIGVAGAGASSLNGPYDAKVIGDFTGLTAPAAMTAGPATIDAGQNAKLGSILVDARGMSLYVFTKDTPNTSTCYDKCASAWPPLLTSGAPLAGPGVDASKFGTATRTDGTTQVTYNGMPLYYFAKDLAAGDTNGQGIGSVWFVISPAGAQIMK